MNTCEQSPFILLFSGVTGKVLPGCASVSSESGFRSRKSCSKASGDWLTVIGLITENENGYVDASVFFELFAFPA